MPVSTTPAPRTAPAPTSTPSSSEQPAPTNAPSSTTTGRAPAGSSTPPILTPAERCTRAPIWAHEPTSTCESTIASSPIHAPTFTNEGGITTTPGPRYTPPRTEVPPGTTRHARPASAAAVASGPWSRSFTGRPMRSWNCSAPPRFHDASARSRKQARIAALTSGSARHPPGAVGSGTAARRRPASRSARIGAESAGAPIDGAPAVPVAGEAIGVDGSPAPVMRPPRRPPARPPSRPRPRPPASVRRRRAGRARGAAT